MYLRKQVAKKTRLQSKKLRRDVMEKLEKQGRIQPDHIYAVHDIRRIWNAFGRGMFPAARNLSQPKVDGGRGFRDPIDQMSDGEAALYQYRYKPWADWAGKQLINNRSEQRITLLQLVYDMVVDNCGPRQWEDRNRVRHGTATRLLAHALDRYLSGF